LGLQVSLDVTTVGDGAAFYGNVLIGDPPPATTHAAPTPSDHFDFDQTREGRADPDDHGDLPHPVDQLDRSRPVEDALGMQGHDDVGHFAHRGT
jgi:hypothetical protein